jgi:hypothetical protein
MATTEVSYDSKRIIPAPLVGISKNFLRSGNGDIINSTFNIVLTGKLFSYKGSPSSSGEFFSGSDYPADESIDSNHRLTSILRKQDALRTLFNADGKTLVIQGADGGTPFRCNPRVISPPQFSEGIWFEYCDYSINLEADRVYPSQEDITTSGLLISDAQESWNIETDETPEGLGLSRTYKLTHSVSAVGKRFYNGAGNLTQEAWKNARDFVVPKLGFDSSYLISSGVKDLTIFPSGALGYNSVYNGYNHLRTENIDRQGGGYSVTETWILTSGTAIEDFSVESINSIDTGLTSVNVQGNIIGLERRGPDSSGLAPIPAGSGTKYFHALKQFNISSGLAFTRAQYYTGYSGLNIMPLEAKVGRNPVTGTINYSFNYDNRPSNILGGRTEHISVHDDLPSDVIAIIPILGRAAGPLFQPINTKREKSRTLTIDATFERPTFGSGTVSDIRYAFYGQRPSSTVISGVISALDPANCGFNTSYRIEDGENYDPYTGKFNRQIKWILQ